MLAKNIIAGKEIINKVGVENKRYDPSNGELVSSYFESTNDDIAAAVDSAENALIQGKWSSDAKVRGNALMKIASILSDNIEHLAGIQSRENGKILKESINDLKISIDLFNYYGGVARSVYGKTSMSSPGKLSMTIREPIGVVAIIVPWNSPFILLSRSLAPALAAGTSVVVKPSSLTPYSIYEFIHLILEHCKEIPPDTLNLLQGSGSHVGNELVLNKKVSLISFTGSSDTGKQIMRDASGTLKRVILELGGKSPNIVFKDANMDNAITGALTAARLRSAGQSCFAGTRLLIEEAAHEKFLKRVKELLPSLKVGNAMDPNSDVGPVISDDQERKVLDYIETGKKSGELLYGGRVLKEGSLSHGHFIMPTVFDNVEPDSRIAQEEIFGPVLSVIPFKSVDDAIELANRTNFGLASAVWTKDLNTALKVAIGIKAGSVWVNTYGKFMSEMESGGYKQSGMGKSRGLMGVESYMELKNITIEMSA